MDRSHATLVIHGYSAAAMFLQGERAGVFAMISIAGAREPRVACEVPHRLDLTLDDGWMCRSQTMSSRCSVR